MNTATVIIFIMVSVGITAFSWSFFRQPRSYGFYRFFAFEWIVLLVLLNADVWFARPFSWAQVFSWSFLLGSLALAVHGFWLIKTAGRPAGQFENTTVLVQRGAYRLIRHPMYASLMLLAIGACAKRVTVVSVLLTGLAVAFLIATARAEEQRNLERFGEIYEEYRKRTWMFVPFLF